MKKQVEEIIYDLSKEAKRIPTSLVNYIAWLEQKLQSIPEEYRASAQVIQEADVMYEDPFLTYKICFKRPETDREQQYREAKEKADEARTRASELELFESLKRKYEAKN